MYVTVTRSDSKKMLIMIDTIVGIWETGNDGGKSEIALKEQKAPVLIKETLSEIELQLEKLKFVTKLD